MSRPSKLLLLFAVAINAASCGPVLFTGVPQNVPLLQEKGEATASAGLSMIENASGFNLQGAAAITDNLALMASFVAMESPKRDDDWMGRGNYIEAGIGWFHKINQGHFTTEIFLGAGIGTLKNERLDSGYYLNTDYIKPFLQPSIGYTSRFFDMAFTPRFGIVSYSGHQTNVGASYASEINNFFDNKSSTMVIEPGVTVRLGYEKIRLQLQYVYSNFNYTSQNLSPVNEEVLSVSLFYLFTNRWKPGN